MLVQAASDTVLLMVEVTDSSETSLYIYTRLDGVAPRQIETVIVIVGNRPASDNSRSRESSDRHTYCQLISYTFRPAEGLIKHQLWK